jgi:hypothetical protein
MTTINVTLAELKTLAATKHIAVQVRETANAFELILGENGTYWTTNVFKDGDARYDAAILSDYNASKAGLRIGQSVEMRTHDGRLQTQPVTLDVGLWHRFTSFGDSATTIGEGTPLRAYIEPGSPNVFINVSFRDWVRVIGGLMKFEGGEMTPDDCDWISLRVLIPNSENLTPSPTNTGNAMTFMNTVIPMAGNGPYNLNLAKANFVPAENNTGFWDWNWPDKGHGILTPNIYQKGEFHVITPDYSAVEFIGKSFLLGAGTKSFTPPNPHPTYVYPGWTIQAEFHKVQNGTKPLMISSEIQTARKSTI